MMYSHESIIDLLIPAINIFILIILALLSEISIL